MGAPARDSIHQRTPVGQRDTRVIQGFIQQTARQQEDSQSYSLAVIGGHALHTSQTALIDVSTYRTTGGCVLTCEVVMPDVLQPAITLGSQISLQGLIQSTRADCHDLEQFFRAHSWQRTRRVRNVDIRISVTLDHFHELSFSQHSNVADLNDVKVSHWTHGFQASQNAIHLAFEFIHTRNHLCMNESDLLCDHRHQSVDIATDHRAVLRRAISRVLRACRQDVSVRNIAFLREATDAAHTHETGQDRATSWDHTHLRHFTQSIGVYRCDIENICGDHSCIPYL